ncbi:MAG: CopG family transcriptional regulator [Thermoprotei archaeon]|nr:MAG: CopG family transcriptional regulator [Thermoprotei archaeon]
MSVTVSFRVPRELKMKMDRLREHINWSEELRRFVENRIREYEQQRAIEELEELIKRLPPSPRGTAHEYVREDRDSD